MSRNNKKKVVVIAPSSPVDKATLNLGIDRLQASNFDVTISPQIFRKTSGYLNGSDQQRLKELNWALNQQEYDIVWIARGGYGLNRIVDDVEVKADNLPWVIGFSDVSALFAKLFIHGHKKSIHGPLISTIHNEQSSTLQCINDIIDERQINYPAIKLISKIDNLSEIKGQLFASNLSILTHLVGSKSMPNLRDCILFLEEVNEKTYRIDRMLTQLVSNKALDGVKAIVLGHFYGCENDCYIPFVDFANLRQMPLFADLPFGHNLPNLPLRIGQNLTLAQSKNTAWRIITDKVIS